ncbi:MAG: TetR/AcrR family transcriptional regulator [Acidimicrobiales bacterium]|nr:TetR/AcrR family transcriptional regulator [Acidimicrobiales bacterium]
MTWGREVSPEVAHTRLLDAAGAVAARRGDIDLTVAEVAAEAGCARGTVYRYVGDRDALRRAFVARESRRVAAAMAVEVAGVDEPDALLVEAVVAAVAQVRARPLLAAWFSEGAAGATGRIALQAEVLHELVVDFVAALVEPGADADLAAEAVVRLVLSLLAVPADPARERRLIEVLAPPVLAAAS